jgi:hypothetical protein
MSETLFPLPMPPRWLVYRTRKSANHLCVVAAQDKAHALRVARGIWALDRTAFAIPERRAF